MRKERGRRRAGSRRRRKARILIQGKLHVAKANAATVMRLQVQALVAEVNSIPLVNKNVGNVVFLL